MQQENLEVFNGIKDGNTAHYKELLLWMFLDMVEVGAEETIPETLAMDKGRLSGFNRQFNFFGTLAAAMTAIKANYSSRLIAMPPTGEPSMHVSDCISKTTDLLENIAKSLEKCIQPDFDKVILIFFLNFFFYLD
jgi:hypothetical protein